MSQIAIVEDDAGLRRGLADCLEDLGHEVRCFPCVEDLRPAIDRWVPDLLVLDLNLPGEGGLPYLRSIREKGPFFDLPVLVVSGRTYARDRIESLEAGADDCMSKPFDPDEFCARVETLIRRGGSKKPVSIEGKGLLQTQDMMVNVGDRSVWNGLRWFNLTTMEFRLLSTFLRYPGKVLSVEELLRMVWEFPPGTGNPSLVRWAVNQLRSKIEIEPSRPKRIVTRPRKGYFFAGKGFSTSGDGAISSFVEPPELASSLLAAAPTGILAVDSHGRFVLWNGGVSRLLGYAKEEVLGSPLHKKVHPEFTQKVQKTLSDMFSSRAQPLGPLSVGFLHKIGHKVEVNLFVYPFKLGDSAYIAGVIHPSDGSFLEEISPDL